MISALALSLLALTSTSTDPLPMPEGALIIRYESDTSSFNAEHGDRLDIIMTVDAGMGTRCADMGGVKLVIADLRVCGGVDF